MKPVISILMTAYNRENMIAMAIDSVLASTFQDFELIIVDDCSRDKTVEIAKNYALRDTRVKVFVNDNNLGDYPNRNKAASFASGKYIKYLDSDDYIYPWGIEFLVRMMEEFPQAGWGICSLWPDDHRPFPFCLLPKEIYEYHYFGPGVFHKAPGSSIFVKEAFDSLGGFMPQRMSGDNEMWHRMALAYPVVLMPDGIIWGRLNLGHESELSHFSKYAIQYEAIKWNYLNHPQNPLSKDQKKKIYKKEIASYLRVVASSVVKFKFNQAKDYAKLILLNFKNQYV